MCASGFRASRFLTDETETSAFGVALASLLKPGDTVLLEGQIGAGKTHLARAIIQSALSVPEDIPSPTYTLVQTYETPIGPIWHTDLYRVTAPEELEELGLLDAFQTAIVLIEWPDRLVDFAPAEALLIHLESEGEGRRMTLTSKARRWAALDLAHV